MKRIWLPQVIVSVMLFLAAYPENPDVYYVLLRWAACPVFIYLTLIAIKQKEAAHQIWLLGIGALIYNPLLDIPGIVSEVLYDDSVGYVFTVLAIMVLLMNVSHQRDLHNDKKTVSLELNDLRKINPTVFDFFKTEFGQKVALILIAGFILLFVLSVFKNT